MHGGFNQAIRGIGFREFLELFERGRGQLLFTAVESALHAGAQHGRHLLIQERLRNFMVFLEHRLGLGQQTQRSSAIELVQRHAAVGFRFKVGKVFGVGLLGGGGKGLVGAGQVAFAHVSCGGLQ